ncbi:MAG: helix-turn-helix domain-containing protein [Clostridium sp.]|nr:helix-turn-helix domain-containing protein [Clostridium sp.]
MNEELVRTQYVIMKILKANKATSYIRAMTITEIAELEGRNKPNTLYKHIKILQNRNLVESGVKAERANSYFINELGLELLGKYDDMEEEKNEC